MWKVLDNGMPADTSPNGACCNVKKGIGWDKSTFETKEEAYQYAVSYLGPQYAPPYELSWLILHDILECYEYSAYEDVIKVIEEK